MAIRKFALYFDNIYTIMSFILTTDSDFALSVTCITYSYILRIPLPTLVFIAA